MSKSNKDNKQESDSAQNKDYILIGHLADQTNQDPC